MPNHAGEYSIVGLELFLGSYNAGREALELNLGCVCTSVYAHSVSCILRNLSGVSSCPELDLLQLLIIPTRI